MTSFQPASTVVTVEFKLPQIRGTYATLKITIKLIH